MARTSRQQCRETRNLLKKYTIEQIAEFREVQVATVQKELSDGELWKKKDLHDEVVKKDKEREKKNKQDHDAARHRFNEDRLLARKGNPTPPVVGAQVE